MTQEIKQSSLTDELKDRIFNLFDKHAKDVIGKSGFSKDLTLFEISDAEGLKACIVFELFWGQLYIKYLIVEEKYRRLGYGTKLIDYTISYAKDKGCSLVFVETMDFQAPKFYQKLGFEIELIRQGFDQGVSFYYMKKHIV